MSWLKIDDRLFLHPKWLATPTGARALWITALSYCGAQCTDGFVAAPVLMILGGTAEDAEALVKSGLWIEADGGWTFHNFNEYNKTSEDRRSISEARAEAGRRGAEAKHQQNSGKTLANDKQNLAPGSRFPVPVSQESVTLPESGESAERGSASAPTTQKPVTSRGMRLPKDWQPHPDDLQAMRQQYPNAPGDWFDDQTERFRDYWAAQPGQKGVKLDWRATWRNWIKNGHDRTAAARPPLSRSAPPPRPHRETMDEARAAIRRDFADLQDDYLAGGFVA